MGGPGLGQLDGRGGCCLAAPPLALFLGWGVNLPKGSRVTPSPFLFLQKKKMVALKASMTFSRRSP